MEVAYLECPECGEDAIPSKMSGCITCDEYGHKRTDACVIIPLWDEGDSGKCPDCGVMLRVVVDDGRAYTEVLEP